MSQLPRKTLSSKLRPYKLNWSRQRLAVLAITMLICAFTGGSFRPAMPSLLILRPALVIAIGVLLALPAQWRWRDIKWPAGLLAVFACAMLIQLVPLPADWWAAMPGHDRYARVLSAIGPIARPISLAPDLTINSVLALLPVALVLIAFASMDDADRWNILWLVLALGALNIVIGIIQAVGGNGPAGLAGPADTGVITGLLANRNHGAALLAIILPFLAVPLRGLVGDRMVSWFVLLGITVIIGLMILLTGSRQGLAFAIIAIMAASVILFDRRKRERERGASMSTRMMAGMALCIALVIGIIILAVANGRALSIDRLATLADPTNEARLRNLPVVIAIVRDFMPFGIGYGAFDPVYRGYEPDILLHSRYFNHAHNDLLEIIASGGVLAIALVAGFTIWFVGVAVSVVRGGGGTDSARLKVAALCGVIIMGLSSLVDYPLRTGIMSMLFAILCCWLAMPSSRSAYLKVVRRGSSGIRS